VRRGNYRPQRGIGPADRPGPGAARRFPRRRVAAAVAAIDVVSVSALYLLVPPTVATLLYGVAVFLALRATGDIDRFRPRVSRDVGGIAARLSVPLVLITVMGPTAGEAVRLTRAVVVVFALVVSGRSAAYWAIRTARARGALVERVVIIGTGKMGVRLADVLGKHPEYGLRPLGFVDVSTSESLSLPVLGEPLDLPTLVDQHVVDRAIFADGAMTETDMVRLIRRCSGLPVEIDVIPRLSEMGAARHPDMDDAWGVPLMRLPRKALRTWAWQSKRVVDVVGAVLLMVAFAPLFGAAAIAIRATGRGPILFRQKRVTQGGRVFELLKFRTLPVNDDSDTTWSVAADHRVPPVGEFLRKTGLDELPQLYNVLKGDMSLVGPRPERPFFVEAFSMRVPGYEDRHRVPGGMTGWAQIHRLRGDTSIEDRATFDNQYIDQWTPGRDLVVLLRSVGEVVRRKGG
jgi:exopolysaccharide biosynthesis polyprenyl glycosylphosphotransferase